MSSSFLINANLHAGLGELTSHVVDDLADDPPSPLGMPGAVERARDIVRPEGVGFLDYEAGRAG